jgi:hypothetical protein
VVRIAFGYTKQNKRFKLNEPKNFSTNAHKVLPHRITVCVSFFGSARVSNKIFFALGSTSVGGAKKKNRNETHGEQERLSRWRNETF